MKIALLASTFLPRIGGAEIVVHNLARQLRAKGHDAHVVAWWGQGRAVAGLVDYPVHSFLPRSYTLASRRRWEAGQGRRWPVALQMAALQARHRFDLCHVHMAYPMGILVGRVLRRMGVPVVTTCHGDDLITMPAIGYTLRQNAWLDAAVREALCASDRLVSISGVMRAALLEAGVASDRIADIPNGVALERFAGVAEKGRAWRTRQRLPPDRLVLLTVGRNHPQKGYAVIPEVARRMVEAGLDFTWLLAGHGTEQVQAAAAAIGLGDRVRSLGQLSPAAAAGAAAFELPNEALLELLGAADLYVCTSVFEGMPLVLLEAMAAGLPLLSTDATGCLDLVQPGRNGLLAPVGDAAALAAHAVHLGRSPALRAELAAGSRQAAARHAWSNIVDEHLAVYRAACARPARRVGT